MPIEWVGQITRVYVNRFYNSKYRVQQAIAQGTYISIGKKPHVSTSNSTQPTDNTWQTFHFRYIKYAVNKP